MRKQSTLPWLLFLVGLACLPLSLVLIGLQDRASSKGGRAALSLLANLSAVVFTIGIIFGGGLVWIRGRRRRALKRYPWVVWPINYITTGRHEWVELLDVNRQPVSALILSTWRKDIATMLDPTTSEIWFAGDPKKYGVISRPGGGDLRYAYYSRARQPPRFTFRDREPGSQHRQAVSTTGASNGYEMHRANSHVMMKPPSGSPENPVRHGGLDDERYPSPRTLRRISAFVLDWLIHAACGIGAGIAVSPAFSPDAVRSLDWRHLGVNPVAVIGFWLAASAVNRVLIQSVFHTTIGKALFGLVILRPDNGKYPLFGKLLGVWIVDLYMSIALPIALVTFSDVPGPDNVDDYLLPAVRRSDVRE